MRCTIFLVVALTAVFGRAMCSLKFSETKINIAVNETKMVKLYVKDEPSLVVSISANQSDVLEISPTIIKIGRLSHQNEIYFVKIKSIVAGETQIFAESAASGLDDVFLTVQVHKSGLLETISTAMGWGYVLAWSIALYPQLFENYKRKSVVGLNFDFLAISTTGFVCYAVFNAGIYYVPLIREQYAARFPRSVISVYLNDVVISIHVSVLFAFSFLQCYWYERGGQTMSWFGKGLNYLTAMVLTVAAGLSVFGVVEWLDFLYTCSYVKLALTVFKYVPQVIMNYQRQSTSGWCIYIVLLDLTGGVLSLLQMFLNAYNYDKLWSVMENPSKLGMGLLTLGFDCVFMAQHYWLYDVDDIAIKADDNLEMDVVGKK